MRKFLFSVTCVFFIGLSGFSQAYSQREVALRALSEAEVEKREALQKLVDKAANDAIEKYKDKGFKPEDLSITLIDLHDPKDEITANYNAAAKIYPASVVKLFYLVAVHRWLEDGRLKDTPELRRAMKDMIVESSNDATQFIVDTLTGVSGGPELSEKELKVWAYKRNAVNRYFTSLGYFNINVCQKTYCEDAYGREQQFRGKDGINRNKLTSYATARLLSEIATGKAVTPDRSKQMMELLKRDFETPRKNNDEDQDYDFTAMALKPGMKLWSKSGWTSQTRHDAAYVETPDGKKFVLSVFTTNFANVKEIIPGIAKIVLDSIK